MLKAPREGGVKTRLARDIGHAEAVEAYRRLVHRQLAQIPATWTVFVAFAPTDAVKEMRTWLGGDVRLFPQSEGDLGNRLLAAVERLGTPLVFLGGDCPYLTHDRLLDVERSGEEAVLWPTMDGGYCLLALRRPVDGIFSEISWGTEAVFEQTRKKIPPGVTIRIMEPALEDVDDIAAWTRALEAGVV